MSSKHTFEFDYESDDEGIQAQTAWNVLASSAEASAEPLGDVYLSQQITPRSSVELAREASRSYDQSTFSEPLSRPVPAATPPTQRPRPVLRGGGPATPEVHELADRGDRSKGVRFDSNEKGDGKRSTPEGLGSPLRYSDLEAINEKLSQESDADEQTEAETEANRLVRAFTHRRQVSTDYEADLESGQTTPKQQGREGLLSLLLRLQPHRHEDPSGASTPGSGMSSPSASLPASGTSTPKHFFSSHRTHSSNSISALLKSSSSLALGTASGSGDKDFHKAVNERLKKEKQKQKKENRHSGTLQQIKRLAKREKKQEQVKTLIAETIHKQQYVIKLCRALMRYGAPTHRLESYMRTSAHSLGIGGQFLYIPGCMIISFDDENTHTAEVKLVREDQGVDLGRMDSVHNIYKQVANGTLLVKEGQACLDDLMRRDAKNPKWILVLMYGLAAASVGPFAFQARMIDTPIAFLLGCIVGFLQHYICTQSELWASCFTILAPFITSALARVFGSIRGGNLFCFSALAQSSIALILPGYTVLCAALELQSGAMVAGSIRLVYAVIYSLFLGFGITLGTAIVGAIWKDATSSTTCQNPISGNGTYLFFLAVPIFTICLTVINQAKWKQAPVQMLISLCGYQVNYWVSQYVSGQPVANAAGAAAVGLLANMYARFGYQHEKKLIRWCRKRIKPRLVRLIPARLLPKRDVHDAEPPLQSGQNTPLEPPADQPVPTTATGKPRHTNTNTSHRLTYGLAAAAMLPAIWVQVPSGLAVQGSLISGIVSADTITGNATASAQSSTNGEANTAVLTVAFGVIQIAVAITVGLFVSTVVVYPRGKKRGGVFTM